MSENRVRPSVPAVITGAASGMGLATAQHFSNAGWPLLLCDLNGEALEAVADSLRGSGPVETVAGDIAREGYPEHLVAVLAGRPVGALVHCAGLSPSMADPARILQVNLAATMALLSALRPRMQKGAAAVVLASSAGHMLGSALDEPLSKVTSPEAVASLVPYAPTPQAAYSISKRAIQLLVRRDAHAFGQQGARLISISPGIIDTRMGRAEMAVEPGMQPMIATAPIPRMGRPEEVAAVALFLCSPAASFVTGVDILVDGGEVSVFLSAQE